MTGARLRKDAVRIFGAALRAADPAEAVLRHARMTGGSLAIARRRYALKAYRNIYVVGAGKASAAMASALEKLLGKRITAGVVNVKYGHTVPLKRVRLNECGHPMPDENGVRGAEEILRLVRSAGEHDLILCVISGGASALLPLPVEPITLAEKQETTKLLLNSGATIHEVNAVRKHISKIKGGRLAKAAAPATVVSLILSDVIGDDLDVIGSGVTAPDSSTFADAIGVLEKYGLAQKAPAAVLTKLHNGGDETPKSLDNVRNVIVGGNELALHAAESEARTLGYKTLVLSSRIEGEAREVAKVHAAIAKEIVASGRPVRRPACVISGGETTVTIRGDGKGGRNQEFVLQAALDLRDLPGVVVLSGGTDGTDGPTDAAGAICDGRTAARASVRGLDAQAYLKNNDSYCFFEPLGDLLKTGPTNTNVMDVRLVLVDSGG